MAWVVPALIAAGTAAGLSATAAGIAAGAIVGAGISGVAAGAMSIANEQYPWDDPGGFFLNQAKAIGMGAAGGALGPALGAAGSALGIGSNVGTTAAAAGAPAGAVSTGTPIGAQTAAVLQTGAAGAEGIGSKLASAGIDIGKQSITGGISGAARDYRNPLRGALVGAAGGAVSGGLNFAGQSTGILPSTPEPNFQPIGSSSGYDAGTASIMPPSPGYTSSGFGPSLGTRAMNAAGSLGVRAGTMGARSMVGNAMTPQPQQPQMGAYASFGIKPYFETGPYR